jgi:hypothetical protein
MRWKIVTGGPRAIGAHDAVCRTANPYYHEAQEVEVGNARASEIVVRQLERPFRGESVLIGSVNVVHLPGVERLQLRVPALCAERHA